MWRARSECMSRKGKWWVILSHRLSLSHRNQWQTKTDWLPINNSDVFRSIFLLLAFTYSDFRSIWYCHEMVCVGETLRNYFICGLLFVIHYTNLVKNHINHTCVTALYRYSNVNSSHFKPQCCILINLMSVEIPCRLNNYVPNITQKRKFYSW